MAEHPAPLCYAEVIIDISHERLDRTFTYRVPPSLLETLREGMVVTVPFGSGGKVRKGYVVGFSAETEVAQEKVKDILSAQSSRETTEERLIAMAAWMREHYGSTMIQALKTVLPIRTTVKSKEKRALVLTASREEAEEALDTLRTTRARARTRVLEALVSSLEGRLPWEEAVTACGATRAVALYLEERGLARLVSAEEYRRPFPKDLYEHQKAVPLSTEQAAVAEAICREWQGDGRPVLLHGVTGSGKTQVYMELIQRTIEEGKQAIVLIPEIALTYQTVKRFAGRFGDVVSVLNSRLSAGERYDQFRRARAGEVKIMVGPRSALFTPFSRLGLIIIDEEHEGAYKSETSPRYHAREAALYRAQTEGAHLLLGSATPSLEAYASAERGDFCLVELKGRYEERPLPQVEIVDLREELKAGNRSVFCRTLEAAMEDRLRKGEQTMLFLNRRGYAGFYSCRSCGHVMKCPHCDVSLSLHGSGRLVCHYCGYQTPAPRQCPSCTSPFIGGFKAGTQQVEESLRKRFPAARVLRMDYDTTRTKGSYDRILDAFARHAADILIGTQMIVKGHDFPHVTLVGAIAADLSLNEGDYRSAERTYQLLCQAVGRSGRGKTPGMAVIQTYHPEHYSIRAAAAQDYQGFYREEMSFRTLMDYPPAGALLAIHGSSTSQEMLHRAMHYLREFILRLHPAEGEPEVMGPAPAPIGKVRDVYRELLHLKHPSRETLVGIKDMTERYIRMNTGFREIQIQFDFQ